MNCFQKKMRSKTFNKMMINKMLIELFQTKKMEDL